MSADTENTSTSELEALLLQAHQQNTQEKPTRQAISEKVSTETSQDIEDKTPLKIGCRAIQNGHGVKVVLAGNLNINARPKWRLLLDKIQKSPARQVEINFSRIGKVSITGIGLILWLKEFLHLERGDLRITGCPDSVRQQLYWFEMDKHCIVMGKNFS